jgi:hypothetical protein
MKTPPKYKDQKYIFAKKKKQVYKIMLKMVAKDEKKFKTTRTLIGLGVSHWVTDSTSGSLVELQSQIKH